MAGKDQYTADDFIKKIPGTGGIISTLSDRVGCSWHTAKKYVDTYPTVQKAYRAEKEKVKDIIESSLINRAEEGEGWAVKYYLSTQAKDRGYTDTRQINQRVQNIDIDLTKLSDDQLRRLAAGEDVIKIISDNE